MSAPLLSTSLSSAINSEGPDPSPPDADQPPWRTALRRHDLLSPPEGERHLRDCRPPARRLADHVKQGRRCCCSYTLIGGRDAVRYGTSK